MFVETVEGAGSRGDVKDVKPGYARNYLLPKGLAVPATPHAVERAAELRVAEAEIGRFLFQRKKKCFVS